jgi:hypothetical protein
MQTHPADLGPIAFAIWKIMDPNLTLGGFNDSNDINAWLTKAAANGGGVNTADFLIYTPNSLTASQEFIRVVPVPPSLLLFAPGLLGLVVVRRRAKK